MTYKQKYFTKILHVLFPRPPFPTAFGAASAAGASTFFFAGIFILFDLKKKLELL
jgi:hypothetical protein